MPAASTEAPACKELALTECTESLFDCEELELVVKKTPGHNAETEAWEPWQRRAQPAHGQAYSVARTGSE